MREAGPSEYGEGSTLTETAATIADQHEILTIRVLADLTDPEQASSMIRHVEGELGPVDIFVHNAGGDIGAFGGKPVPNDCVHISAVDVRSIVERNFLATVFACQAVAPGMIERRNGRIITISSTGAFIGRPNAAIYAAARAGVVHYTRCLATQLRPFMVTANSIAPGETRTARFLATRFVSEERLAVNGTLDRIAYVDEVSRVVEFFAGPLGTFVSGQALRVDGGGQCWPA